MTDTRFCKGLFICPTVFKVRFRVRTSSTTTPYSIIEINMPTSIPIKLYRIQGTYKVVKACSINYTFNMPRDKHFDV